MQRSSSNLENTSSVKLDDTPSPPLPPPPPLWLSLPFGCARPMIEPSGDDGSLYSFKVKLDATELLSKKVGCAMPMIEPSGDDGNLCSSTESSSSHEIENDDSISQDEWLRSIQNSVEYHTRKKLQTEKVPSMLSNIESNKECYAPLVVSIGPYHHGKPELKEVEMLKLPFAKKLLRACGGNQVSIKQLYAKVEKLAKTAHEYYVEYKNEYYVYDHKSFTKMMFLDACFVLQFMCILTNADTEDPNYKMKSYKTTFVWRDLFLLENQIPLPVLEVLLNFRMKSEIMEKKLIQDFLNTATRIKPPGEISCITAVKKFVGKYCFNGDQIEEKQLQLDASPHLLDLMWRHLTGPPTPQGRIPKKSNQWHSYRSITELNAAGILFKASKTHRVTDVKFKNNLVSATIVLPPLRVDDLTKSLLLNLVAYEMSPTGPSYSCITSYIWLMDSLIDRADDVKELRKKRILVNNLGSDEQLATLFNEIGINLVPDLNAYAEIKDQIENHCTSKGRVWMAEWMHDHFNSPWTILAFLAATFVLALTVVQTYFTIFPKSDGKGSK